MGKYILKELAVSMFPFMAGIILHVYMCLMCMCAFHTFNVHRKCYRRTNNLPQHMILCAYALPSHGIITFEIDFFIRVAQTEMRPAFVRLFQRADLLNSMNVASCAQSNV